MHFAPRGLRGALAALLLGSLAAACQQADPGYLDVPGGQKLTWFAYLDAGDLRANCGPATPDRYRLVYNGHYNEQLRRYEVEGGAGRGEALVTAAVQQGSGLTIGGSSITFDDPFASWAWKSSQERMTAADFDALDRALEADGAFSPPPVGLRLHSNAFWWIAAGCRAGRPFFHAWVHPDRDLTALFFPERLYAYDGTGVRVKPPRARDLGERTSANTPPRVSGEAARRPYFVMEVGQDGLKGVGPDTRQGG